MNHDYEYDTQSMETMDSDERTSVSPTSEPFVPREPNPSQWAMNEIRLVFTRGEELFTYIMAGFLAVTLLVMTIFLATTAKVWTTPTAPMGNSQEQETQPPVQVPDVDKGVFADGQKGNVLYQNADSVAQISLDQLTATHAALAKVSDGKIIASSGADEKVYPASITKIMTMIVVVEHLRSEAALQETITISYDIVKAMQAAEASGIGFAAGEKLTVESLLYALMLRSDGVAACELARYIAITEDAFVALMNQKAQEMGLTGTHFTNPVGLYHENHYSTCRDLATLIGYAMNMSLCRKIMTEDAIDADCTQANGSTFPYHIYNNLLETFFKTTYKNLNPATAGKLTVIAGKTGYTPESKYCLATCAMAADGSYYVCVTVGANGYEDCIKSYQKIYSQYVG